MEGLVKMLKTDGLRRARIEIPGASITSLAALAPAIRAWPALTDFELDATASENLEDAAVLESLAECSQLTVVKCNFSKCCSLRDVAVAALGKGLSALGRLQHLQHSVG